MSDSVLTYDVGFDTRYRLRQDGGPNFAYLRRVNSLIKAFAYLFKVKSFRLIVVLVAVLSFMLKPVIFWLRNSERYLKLPVSLNGNMAVKDRLVVLGQPELLISSETETTAELLLEVEFLF